LKRQKLTYTFQSCHQRFHIPLKSLGKHTVTIFWSDVVLFLNFLTRSILSQTCRVNAAHSGPKRYLFPWVAGCIAGHGCAHAPCSQLGPPACPQHRPHKLGQQQSFKKVVLDRQYSKNASGENISQQTHDQALHVGRASVSGSVKRHFSWS
jgi:hypothetical protein